MIHLFDQLSKKNKFNLFNTDKKFWVNFEAPQNNHIKDNFIDTIGKRIRENYKTVGQSRIVVVGHFWQTEFANDTFNHKFEYINLIRDCLSRRRSKFYFALYDLSAGHDAKHKKIVLQEKLNSSDPDRCIQDIECLRRTGDEVFSRHPIELKHICGLKCNVDYEEPYKSLLRLRDPSKLTVLGLLDNITAYMDMLECAYPTLLQNISVTYNRLHEVRCKAYIMIE
jgi:hypothetical protein